MGRKKRKSIQVAAVAQDASPEAAVSESSAAATEIIVEAIIPPAETNGVATESEVAQLAEDIKKNLVVSQPEKEVVMQEENTADAAPVEEAAAAADVTPDDDDDAAAVETKKAAVVIVYRDGYWNPTTQIGKKAYDKTQFLQIKELESSKVKPANMPKYDIVRENINTHNVMERRVPVNIPMPGMDFTPPFMRGASGGYNSNNKGYGNMNRGGSNSMQGRRNIKPQKIIDAKPTIKATLKTTENAWSSTIVRTETSEGPDKLKKSLIGFLNKLTPENFPKVQPQIKILVIQNPDLTQTTINVFYNKAIDEPHFSAIYAKVCKSVVENNISKDPSQAKSLHETVSKFKRDLLVKCQNEFERTHQFGAYQVSVDKSLKAIEECTDEETKKQMMKAHDERFENKLVEQIDDLKAKIKAAPDANKKELEEELEYLENKFGKRSIGLIKFVGELYRTNLLTLKIMLPLLEKFGQNVVRCHTAEALCKLMTTVGGTMWNESKENEKNTIRAVMDRCRDFTKTTVVENRIRFLLLDIIELYDNKFIPKHKSQQTVGPSTKQEVHNKMIMEEENEKINLNNTSRSSNMDNRDRRGGRGSMNKESLVSGNTEVWKTVLNSNTSSKKNNSLRNLNNRHSDTSGETPRLGPGGSYSAWGFGASGGSGANKDNSRGGSMSGGGEPRQQSNRFIALQDDDMPDYNINNKRSNSRLIRDNPFKSNNHSQNTNSYDRKLTRPEIPVKKPLNTEAIKERTVANVEEYCCIQDIKEAVLDIETKFESREMPHYIYFAMIVVFEMKDMDREVLGKLFEYLLVNKKISYTNFVEGLKLVVADVDDLACDIPQIQDYFGKVLAPVVFNSLLPLSEILTITASETEKVTRTFAKALIRLSILNKEIMLTLWYQSRLKFETILGSDAEVNEFFDKYEELKYLNEKEENQRVEVYSNCLKKSLFKPVSTEKIKRIVATVVGSGIPAPYKAMSDEQVDTVFEKLSALKLVMKSEGLESKDNFMAVLYGLQAIAVQHSVPPGLLETLFSSALDAGVVDEANIMDWENNPDQKLMGNCVASLGSFLRTLKMPKE